MNDVIDGLTIKLYRTLFISFLSLLCCGFLFYNMIALDLSSDECRDYVSSLSFSNNSSGNTIKCTSEQKCCHSLGDTNHNSLHEPLLPAKNAIIEHFLWVYHQAFQPS